MTEAPKAQFKRWLFSPPQPHGAVIKDRTVSNLELFYDLVYVAVIGQASHHLAESISLQSFVEFAIVFTMIWFAWFNGSLYIELHGREDGRTRLQVFFQMGILALLAVFTADAAGSTGPQFAIVYAIFLAFMGFQWYAIRELDRVERPEFLRITAFYVGGMALSTIVVGATAFFTDATLRLVVWAVFAAGWLAFIQLGARSGRQAEGILRTNGATAKGFKTVLNAKGTTGYRFVDAFDPVTLVAREAKTGRADLTPFIQRQIDKDVLLRARGAFSEVEWHFFPSAASETLGPTKALIDELNAKGIPYVIHLP